MLIQLIYFTSKVIHKEVTDKLMLEINRNFAAFFWKLVHKFKVCKKEVIIINQVFAFI